MAKIIWSPSSIEDLEQIYEYIAKDSPNQAGLFVEKIINLTEKIKDFPYIGKVIKEYRDDNYRELIIHSYRIMYKIINKMEIRILGVIHGARNWNHEK
jgi:addiction module RelE/StbE family toxin